MRTTKPITVSLPTDLLRETQRVAREEARTRSELIRNTLMQYLASRRWQRLRQWGDETGERLGLKTKADLQRLLGEVRTGRWKAQGDPACCRHECLYLRYPFRRNLRGCPSACPGWNRRIISLSGDQKRAEVGAWARFRTGGDPSTGSLCRGKRDHLDRQTISHAFRSSHT